MTLGERSIHQLFFLHFEWMILASFLMIPLFINPAASTFTFCVLSQAGIDICPGCGLGRSVAYLYRGDFAASFSMHPLGILAVLVIALRVVQIFSRNRNFDKPDVYEKDI